MLVLLRVVAVAIVVHPTRRVDDRTIAGAAAEVAGERIINDATRRALDGLVQREQRHHEARRAKAALRAVAVDERLLDRMQRAVCAGQALDGDELLAVERRHELDARIDRAKADPAAVKLADDDGTGAAIAFGTAFLGSGAAQILAQKLKDRAGRVDGIERNDVAVEREANRRAAGRRLRLLPRHRESLTAAICGITPGRHQQRHVVMLVPVGDAESQHDVADKRRIRKFNAGAREIGAGAEHDLVNAGGERCAFEQRAIGSTVGVRENARQARAAVVDAIDGDLDARARPPLCCIKDVRRQATHADLAMITA